MEIKNAKIMSGVGAILEITGQFTLIGIILKLIGIHKISIAAKDKRIFNYMLWPSILLFVIFILIILTGNIFYLSVSKIDMTVLDDWMNYQNNSVFVNEPNFFVNNFSFLHFTNMFLLLLLSIALMIVPIIYQIKSYNLIKDCFKNDNFDKAAKFLKWGLILSIVMVGFILIFIAKIFAIIGYFTLPDEYPENITDEELWKSY
ncbi:Uncharacterized membrane protein [Marinitoga hydrogenitolerans DSM 16785]|uniref:Uncharacterized membrane protein n=1 Tax=Marinitoga hydrogenitolerans (strain DSM 16785 / JCM 12826 / AT1271) TaxID=1122195 RepID=A0A1M4Z3E8_MARH1|nr:DUF996 domain-containing protein [Marinitoga hydrogenitolerans]SHF12593.1 Uncharacterized membrane protein [Marinitoga hydrogenitolerans DSM 16785]